MKKRKVTQKQLDENPLLKELGIGVGWSINVTKDEVSLEKSTSNESSTTTEGGESGNDEGDGESGDPGSNNPGKKPPF